MNTPFLFTDVAQQQMPWKQSKCNLTSLDEQIWQSATSELALVLAVPTIFSSDEAAANLVKALLEASLPAGG